MKTKACLLVSILFVISCSISAESPSPGPYESKNQAVAFVNVNVVPMDRERVLTDQTVIVREGVIAEIGSANKIKVPDGALRVDGRGKYLMPGLAEMHAHLPFPNMDEKTAHSILFLFIANGITTVRGMQGHPIQLAMRDKIARGELLGPTIYAGSPAMSGQSVKSAEEARQKVREYKEAGFDLLKVHEGLSVESYDAIVATANQLGIPFGGHVSDIVGLHHAIKSRQSTVDHLDNFVEALEADDSPIRNADAQTRAQKLAYHLDERKIPALARETREAGVWVVPTQALWKVLLGGESLEKLRQHPELKYMPPQMVNQWITQLSNRNVPADKEAISRVIKTRDKILKALSEAGAGILLGSDAPQIFSVPGFSIHREMAAMVEAGLSPYQIIESGTRNVAVYFNTMKETGTIEKGKRADLILVNGNPLKDIGNIARRSGVMVRGRWLPESEIQKMLDDLVAKYARN